MCAHPRHRGMWGFACYNLKDRYGQIYDILYKSIQRMRQRERLTQDNLVLKGLGRGCALRILLGWNGRGFCTQFRSDYGGLTFQPSILVETPRGFESRPGVFRERTYCFLTAPETASKTVMTVAQWNGANQWRKKTAKKCQSFSNNSAHNWHQKPKESSLAAAPGHRF